MLAHVSLAVAGRSPGRSDPRRSLRTSPHASLVGSATHSPGQVLPPGVRTEMEARFGIDFGQVRVHSDPGSAESACALGANAYTLGSHIYLGRSPSSPNSTSGPHVL